MLTPDQRRAMSREILEIPEKNKQIDETSSQLTEEVAKLKELDDSNKAFFDQKNALVNSYQGEIGLKTGNLRTQVTEQNIIDAADMKSGNVFFPNEISSPPPSIPGGIWLQMSPFLLGYGVGKTKLEVYTYSADNETALTSYIGGKITQIEGKSNLYRTTGQNCTVVVSPPSNTIGPDPNLPGWKTELVAAVNSLRANLVLQKASLYLADSDPTRQSKNQQESDDIDDLIEEIDDWLGYPDFSPYSGPSDCATFNGTNPMTLPASKLRSDILPILKNALSARSSIKSAREGDVTSWLGTIVQDPSTGVTSSLTGFYGDRARFLFQRLHRLTGSMQRYRSAQRGASTNQEFKSANDMSSDTLKTLMYVEKLLVSSSGTNIIAVKGGFSVGDKVFVASNEKDEIAATVQKVDGLNLTLNKDIPVGYWDSDLARVYKMLS